MKKFAFQLPMLASHSLKPLIRPVSSNKVNMFLGKTFYVRLSNIYRNSVTAIAEDDWKYLATSLDSELYKELTEQIIRIKGNNFKIKMVQGKGIKLGYGKKRNKYKIRENQWFDEWSKISVECRVIFGDSFGVHLKDVKGGSLQKEQIQSQEKTLYKIGPYRTLAYKPQLGLFANLKSFYNDQTFEFRIRVKSSIRLQVIGKQGQVVSQDLADSDGKEVTTQIIMKSGNQGFNWLITRINGMGGKNPR